MSTSTPDLSGLSQPGAQAPAANPTPAPPAAHGRLLSMIQGLALGVDSFARAAATHGREGGVGEVQEFNARQQAQKIQAQEEATRQTEAQQRMQETDLRMSELRAHMAVDQFQFETLRARAPLEQQKLVNDVSEQQMSFMEHLSKATGLPLMVINSMANDDTQSTLGAVSDTAKQNNTTIHDTAWSHVQNEGAPGNGSVIKGFDLKNFGNTPIPAASSDQAILPVKTQIQMGEGILGADDPTVKGGKQALDLLQKGLASGQMTANQYYMLANKINAPIVNAINVKNAKTEAQKRQSEAEKAASDAAKAAREANPQTAASDAALKAAAEARAQQPYQVALKQMEGPIALGVANQKEAGTLIENNYATPYANTMANIAGLNASLDDAKLGNVAAAKASLFKLLGVVIPPGSKKVPPEAISAMEGMGTSGQKLVGSIQKIFTGDKWTESQIEDVRAFANDQAKVAQDHLRAGVHMTNIIKGTNVDPEALIQAAGFQTAEQMPQGGGVIGDVKALGKKAAKWAANPQ